MKRWLASGLGLFLGLTAPHAVAQAPSWNRPNRVQLGSPASAATPAATLGRPVTTADTDSPSEFEPAPVQRVAYQRDGESAAATVFRLQAPDYDPPPPFRP